MEMPLSLLDHRLPPLLLGITVATYWGRVLRMAYKTWRRTGKAANLVPAEPMGRVIRVLWFPAIIIWVIHPFVSALILDPPRILRSLYVSKWIAWPALLIAASCFFLTRICWKSMGKAWRMGIDPIEKNPLIATGPFAYVRHPIYTLSILMMMATMAMIPSILMLAAGLIHIIFLCWEARREEQHFLRIHGDIYTQYSHRVSRFFPKLGSLRAATESQA